MTKTDIDPREPSFPDLRKMTQARVMLGRHGAGVPTRAAQAFLLDHARARQAVWTEIDWAALLSEFSDPAREIIEVESQAVDRSTYVRRPDLGRLLSTESVERLALVRRRCDVVIVVGDGLSASAITINAVGMVQAIERKLVARRLSLAPIVLASHARVALADPIGELLGARLSIMLIGERPGLSAADSLGIYVTYKPASGTADSGRNCISNVRERGLSIDAAAEILDALVVDSLRAGVSGVLLSRTSYQKQLLGDVSSAT